MTRALLTVAAAFVIARLCGPIRAAEQPAAPEPAGRETPVEWWKKQVDELRLPEAAPGRRWWEEALRDLPDCGRYTDGCRLCIGSKAAGLSCSTPGIACVPAQWTCAPAK